jgi:Holliday junction resolvase RusA-like endonuclease
MTDTYRPTRRLTVEVVGRPAPQGSKRLGEHGQMREQSAYLPAWRAAVKLAVYGRYKEIGVRPADLPMFVGPVRVAVTFYLSDATRVDGPPDLDKLLRSTLDALGGSKSGARVFEDDSRVVWVQACKVAVTDTASTGADIEVWPHQTERGLDTW